MKTILIILILTIIGAGYLHSKYVENKCAALIEIHNSIDDNEHYLVNRNAIFGFLKITIRKDLMSGKELKKEFEVHISNICEE